MTNQAPNGRKQKKFFGPFPQQPRVSPDEAKKYRRERKIPADIVRIESTRVPAQRTAMSGGNPLAIPSISEQARALRHDVDLIYQYVHDNVEFIPTYGLHKGGLGALVDGSGNQFDQCDLMVSLLVASGYTAEYVIGQIRLTSAQWSSWLGVDQANIALAVQMLNNGGIAVHGIIGTDLIFEHCWVKVNIDSTDYYFDPSLKSHSVTNGIDLATALGYDRSTFLADATATATIDPGNSVKNIDATSIQSHLTSYSTSLVDWIKQNNPSATFDQILGGRSIEPTTGIVRNTSLPYAYVIDQETSTIPDSYKCFFQFEYDLDASTGNYRINVGGYTDVIYGQRFTLWWDGTGKAAVYFDGNQVGPLSTAKADGAIEDARITVYHPYAFASQQSLQPIIGRAPAWIGTCFGLGSKQLAAIHQELQNEYFAAGLAATSEPLLGQSLSLIWDNFIGQSSDGVDILKRLGNAEIVLHHFVGIVSQAKKPSTTTKIKSVTSFMSQWNTSARASGVDLTSTNFAMSLFVQSLEGTSSEQVTGVEAGDAIKVISICNQAGVDIFDAKSSNWNTGANIRSQLSASGYNTNVLNEIEDWLNLGTSWRAVVPNDPTVQIGSFSDFYGYIAADGPSTYSMTWFGAKGAASAGGQDDASTNSAASDNARQVNGFGMPAITATESARVNMLNGRYEYSSTDLVVGNQGAPYELAFVRSYNSALRLSLAKVSTGDKGLGFGWTHNWLMSASVNSDGFICLGDQQVSAAAAAISTLVVMRDVALSNTAMPIENFVIECEVARFLISQFAKNVVRIATGGSTLMFLKMPDGTYLPPLGAHAKSKLEKLQTGTPPQDYFQYTTSDGVVYKYKPSGEIETITYPYGITITFTYASGRLTKVSNGFRDLNFTYDTFGQLATVHDGNGRTVTLTVPTTGAQAGNLTAVKDPLNKTTTYNYDQRGRLTQVFKPANPSAAVFTNTYDTLHRVKEQRDAYDNLWQFFIAGTRNEEVAPNGTSRVTYFNAAGAPVRTINPLGQEMTTQYDGNQRVVLQTFPEGNSVATTYDADGNTISVTQHPKPGSGLASRTVSYTYETTWNQAETVTDTAGNTTTYEYYPASVAGASRVKKITGPAVAGGTPITSFEYNSKGQLTKSIDPTAVVTVSTYDAADKNNMRSQTVDPTGKNITTQFAYDAVGNLVNTTDPNGNVTTVVFDALRRPTQVTGPAPFSPVASLTYDDNGNVIQARNLASSDPNSRVIERTYTIDGKLLTVVGPSNFGSGAQPVPTRYEYDIMRRAQKITDSLGRVSTMLYDALSRPVSVSVDGSAQQMLSYTANGMLESATDARNETTEYQYDGFDRQKRITYPDSSFAEAVYDSRDNVTQAITRAGDTFSFDYDALSRMLSRMPAGGPTVSFSYDLAGRRLTASTPVIPGDPSSGTFSLAYDSAGRWIQEEYPDGKTVLAELDNNGNVTELTYPSGAQITYSFDQLDRLTSVNGLGGSVALAYDSTSRRRSQINGNGTGQGYSFDKVDNLLSMTIGGLKPNIALPMAPKVDFAFGVNDLQMQIDRRCSDPSFNWEPNLMKTVTYGTANNVNQYPSVDGVGFTYNGNGCLTDDGVNSYAYDSESKLTSVTTPSGTVTFKYDPLGRLMQKIVGSNKTRYVYSAQQRIEEYDDSGNLLRRYVYGWGLDECLFVVDAGIRYLHNDQTGSVILITDAAGAPVQRNVYTPWGELASGSLSDVGIGFTGQFYDSDADIYYHKNRHYSPVLGRFLQPDPVGYDGGLNLYEYCGGDPVNYSDPFGLQQQQTTTPLLKGYISAQFGGIATETFPMFNSWLVGYNTLSGVYGRGGGFGGYGSSGGFGLVDTGNPTLNYMLSVAMWIAWVQQTLAAQQQVAQASVAAANEAAAAQAAALAAMRAQVLGRLATSVGTSVGAPALVAGVGVTALGAAIADVPALAARTYANTEILFKTDPLARGNKLTSPHAAYVYIITAPPGTPSPYGKVGPSGIYKYGMGELDPGLSRLNNQLKRLGKNFTGTPIMIHPDRISARIHEAAMILDHRAKNKGAAPVGNRTPF